VTVWLADTSVLVDHVRDLPVAVETLRSRTGSGDAVWSVVTVRSELLVGAGPEDGPSISEIMRAVSWLDIDATLADLAGRMARHYRRTHPGISVLDYQVAAGAQILGAQLLTLNTKHFPMFPDLRPPY
jgi:predicted nucleic acid-binding protein